MTDAETTCGSRTISSVAMTDAYARRPQWQTKVYNIWDRSGTRSRTATEKQRAVEEGVGACLVSAGDLPLAPGPSAYPPHSSLLFFIVAITTTSTLSTPHSSSVSTRDIHCERYSSDSTEPFEQSERNTQRPSRYPFVRSSPMLRVFFT